MKLGHITAIFKDAVGIVSPVLLEHFGSKLGENEKIFCRKYQKAYLFIILCQLRHHASKSIQEMSAYAET